MKSSVVDGGIVIGMELSRDMCSAALYIDKFDYSKLNTIGIEQKIRRNSLDSVKKDFEIGLKLPVYMRNIGLRDIGVRMNDSVHFFTPQDKNYSIEYKAFVSGEYSTVYSDDMKPGMVEELN